MSAQGIETTSARPVGLAAMPELRRDYCAEVLSRRGWLSEQPKAFRQQIMGMIVPVQLRRKAYLFSVDSPAGGIYGVVSGGIGIEGSGPYNVPRLGHILRSGSWLGHGPAMTGRDHRVQNMRAIEDSELVYVPLPPLRALIGTDPLAARCVGAIADGGNILGTRIISDLLIPSVPHRVAAVLLRVMGIEEGIEPDHPDGFLITQSDLGEMANVSRSNVNRVLRDFAKVGWISKHYNRLRICDVAGLQAFAASLV